MQLQAKIVIIGAIVLAAVLGLGIFGQKYISETRQSSQQAISEKLELEKLIVTLKADQEHTLSDSAKLSSKLEEAIAKQAILEDKYQALQTEYKDLLAQNKLLTQALKQAQNNNKSQEQNTSKKQPGFDYQCPTAATVNQMLPEGFIEQDKHLTWWVDYTLRPMDQNEEAKNLFKVLLSKDNKNIACYYNTGDKDSDKIGANILIIKSATNNIPIQIPEVNWEKCKSQDCASICSIEDMSTCNFKIINNH